MEAADQAAVAKALDSSITHIASRELVRLSTKADDGQIVAKKIHEALRSLQGLRGFQDKDRKPSYDDPWVALLYLTWYQPTQVNLAYTLGREVLNDKKPFLKGNLQVVDFGCGALAMLFGLALAATETHSKDHAHPHISIDPIDESHHMLRIGLNVWFRFVKEIGDVENYPILQAMREVLRAVKTSVRRDTPTRWLTALHVAYQENADAVRGHLDLEVRKLKPDVVLVTSRGEAACWAYSLDNTAYAGEEKNIDGEQLGLSNGSFELTSAFRRTLYTENIRDMPDDLFDGDKDFLRRYLTQYPTTWCNPGFESMWRIYYRT